MKVVILAGGLGTRLSEETEMRPKPMVEVGGRPILWHIMKLYAHQGFGEFVVALGYKGDVIKRFFVDYCDAARQHDGRSRATARPARRRQREDWTVHLVETGQDTNTGGRVGRLRATCATARSCSPTATAWGRRPARAAPTSTARTASWRR